MNKENKKSDHKNGRMPGNLAERVWTQSLEQSIALQSEVRKGKRMSIPLKLARLPELQRYTSSLMTGLYLVSAETNSGKSMLLTSVALDLVQENPDVCVVYLSLDDDYWEVHNRLVASLEEVCMSEAVVCDFASSESKQRFIRGSRRLQEYMVQRRFCIAEFSALDALGTGTSRFDRVLSGLQVFLREELGYSEKSHKQIVVCIDNVSNLNLHNERDPYDGSGELMLTLQDIAKTLRICLFVTTETSEKEGRKGKPRGSQTNAFASRMVFHLREPQPTEASQYYDQLSGVEERLMILEIKKNKASGLRKAALPLAVRDEFGKVRTVPVTPTRQPTVRLRKSRNKDERSE